MQHMIRLLNLFDATLQLEVNVPCLPALGEWEKQETAMGICKPDKKLLLMDRIAAWMRHEGLFYCEGQYVRVAPGTRSCRQVVHQDFVALLKALVKHRDLRNDVVALHTQMAKLPQWMLESSLPQMGVMWNVLELDDCYVTQGRKNPSPGDPLWSVDADIPPGFFAAMRVKIARAQVHVGAVYQVHPPAHDLRALCPLWWQIVMNAFRPHLVESPLQVEDLLTLLAHSLMRQNQKDPVPFLAGESNSGKSSLIEPIKVFFGPTLKAVVHGSNFPLEHVPEARYLIFEEFRLNTLPSNILFQLLEHSDVMCKPLYKSAVQVRCDMGMVAMNNYIPRFADANKGLQPALDNRFRYFEFKHPMPNNDTGARQKIGQQEAPYVILFLYMIYQGVQQL